MGYSRAAHRAILESPGCGRQAKGACAIDDGDQQPEASSEIPRRGSSSATIYCPECAHNLTGVRQAGLDCCPECGEKIDFANLLQAVDNPLDLSGYGYWQLSWRLFLVTLRFRRVLQQEHYRLVLPKCRNWYYVPPLALMALSLALALGPWRRAYEGAYALLSVAAVYGLAMLLVHKAAELWVRMLLWRSDHPSPAKAAGRIMFAVGTFNLPIAINAALWFICMTILPFSPLSKRYDALYLFVACTLIFTMAFHFFLWFEWARLIERMFFYETYIRKVPRWLRFVNRFCLGMGAALFVLAAVIVGAFIIAYLITFVFGWVT